MRYFFDLVEASGETPDPEGLVLGTFQEMRLEAKRILARVAAEEPYADDMIALSVRVRDGDGRMVYNASLSIKGNCLQH